MSSTAGQTLHGAGIGFMASMLQPTAEVAPDRHTSARTGFLWRHRAAQPVPRPAEQTQSWRGAVAAELRRDGTAVAGTAQQGGSALANAARGVRQAVAAGLPAPSVKAAGSVIVVAGLTTALLILLRLTARLVKSRLHSRQVSTVERTPMPGHVASRINRCRCETVQIKY